LVGWATTQQDHRERPVQSGLAQPFQRGGAAVHLPQVGDGVPGGPADGRDRVAHQPSHREHLRAQDAAHGDPGPGEAVLGRVPLLRRRQLRAHLRRRRAVRRLRPHRRGPRHPRDQGLPQRRRHAQHVRRAAAHRQGSIRSHSRIVFFNPLGDDRRSTNNLLACRSSAASARCLRGLIWARKAPWCTSARAWRTC
jgi:hypothetical protein